MVSLSSHNQKVDPKSGQASETPVGMMDVYQEFNELSEKFKIMKFKSKVWYQKYFLPISQLTPG